MKSEPSRTGRTSLTQALIVAALLIGASALLALLSPEHISSDLARRTLGVLLGGITVWYANAVPKALSPLVQMRCDPAAEQSMRRFTGWSIAVGGMLFALAWAAAPMQIARMLSVSLLGTALLLVVVRLGWGLSSRVARG